MYLKNLEIQGFKSFPEKTTIHFDRGITAIVGPNGAGKSNISDAIRWVLGEQSTKTLRGSKMEDVVFGGTAKRGPQGFAQVSLTIDNEDGQMNCEYKELTVTRRYYRSGESEFYINRNPVRLRDIHELFMDTGLGRDGYSIIGQGRIDEILSLKSEDRREIFEEAAGISKFRYRKEEAERKLSATDDNLQRINDITSELESQIEPLREQAEKAKKFLTFRDEMRVLEVSLWLDSLEKLKAGLISSRGDYETAAQQLAETQSACDELYADAEKLAEEMREKDRETDRVREELRGLEATVSEEEGKVAVLRGQRDNNLSNIERIKKELVDQEDRGGGLLAQIESGRTRAKELSDIADAARLEIDELSLKMESILKEADDIDTKIDALSATSSLKSAMCESARADLAAQIAKEQEINARMAGVDAELSERRKAVENEELYSKELSSALYENKDKLESACNMLKGITLKAESRRKRVDEGKTRKAQADAALLKAEQRISILSDMEKDYEGFSRAVKLIMQESSRGSLRNIHGPVSKLIKVEDKFTAAIEIALSGALQNIVVDREEDAKSAIGFLKSSDAGRATFLPLSAVRGNELSEKGLSSENGFLGLGSELCSYDKEYDGIFKSLLGRTAIVDHIDTAIRIAKKYSYKFRIVTLDGQVINAGGAMTGGSLGRNTGILSRANELSRLLSEKEQLSENAAKCARELSEFERELSAMSHDIEMLEAQKREAQDALLKLEAESSQHKLLVDSMKSYMDDLNRERAALDLRKGEISRAKDEISSKIEIYEREKAEADLKINEMSGGRQAIDEKCGSFADDISSLRTKIAEAEAERKAVVAAADDLQAHYNDFLSDREIREQLIIEYEESNVKIGEEEKTRVESIEGYRASLKNLEDIIRRINEEKMRLEGERTRKEKEAQEKNQDLLRLERERARLENKKTQAEMEERQILDKLWDTYELTHMSAQSVRIEIESTAKANRRVNELKNGIRELGAVNIGAVEEFDRVNERYQFLSEQKNDLIKASDELHKVIDEITNKMRTIFSEQFKIINEKFDETFKEIFGGGRAELEMEDPSNILECGIEIRVSLPGKALKTITLLSGGEKAFVAIALYFAILKVKPTPFCVLDEIEAALDDVNVRRFAEYLRTLCERTQFIAITHRRGTMEEADMLYGVTMQELGVSKMLALNVNEVERELKIKIK